MANRKNDNASGMRTHSNFKFHAIRRRRALHQSCGTSRAHVVRHETRGDRLWAELQARGGDAGDTGDGRDRVGYCFVVAR